ncbi:MAG: MFS transporter [FCB group bacterium]|nr:MFS transporter [FCB group bacterium]
MSNYRKILFATIIGHGLVHSITLVFPAIMVVLRDEFSISLIKLGELATIQFVFFGISAVPAGLLVDKLGSRKVLLIYFTGLVLGVAIITLGHTHLTLAAGLALLGASAGLYHPAGLKLISHTKNISQNMGYHGISGSIGLSVGPLIGGVFSSYFNWKMPYFILAGVAVIGGIYTLTQIEPGRQGTVSNNAPLTKFKLKRSHYLIFGVAALWGFTHHGLFNFLPLYFADSLQWGGKAAMRGGLLTAAVLLLGTIGQIAGGKIGSIYPREKLLVWVVGLNIPFLILMGLSHGIILLLVTGILGAVNFTYQPVNNSLLSDMTRPGNRGLVYGLSSGLGFGVGSFATTIGGYIGEHFELSYIFPLLSIVLIPAVVLSYLIHIED